jgi:hypothetical protein
MSNTGWVALAGHMITAGTSFETVYSWDRKYWPTKEKAVDAGFPLAGGTDDFNLAHIEDGKVTWWGWMDKPHPLADADEAADQFGWTVAEQQSGVQS